MAAITGKLEVEVEIKSDAQKYWKNIRESHTLFPKICSDLYKSIEVLEGDGRSVGSVRLITYADGTPLVTFSKEKAEVFDDENMAMGYSILEGELMEYYKKFEAHFTVCSKEKGTEGCLVKWWCDFEKTSHEIPDPNAIQEFTVKNLKEVDDYTLQQA
ncbi:MLP-like protein 423 [Apium graveolens]|uniref:MLP-like protein 423 n=1 Tax=Apium graveolens TaxID=4045 RepID=UPI003D79020E